MGIACSNASSACMFHPRRNHYRRPRAHECLRSFAGKLLCRFKSWGSSAKTIVWVELEESRACARSDEFGPETHCSKSRRFDLRCSDFKARRKQTEKLWPFIGAGEFDWPFGLKEPNSGRCCRNFRPETAKASGFKLELLVSQKRDERKGTRVPARNWFDWKSKGRLGKGLGSLGRCRRLVEASSWERKLFGFAAVEEAQQSARLQKVSCSLWLANWTESSRSPMLNILKWLWYSGMLWVRTTRPNFMLFRPRRIKPVPEQGGAILLGLVGCLLRPSLLGPLVRDPQSDLSCTYADKQLVSKNLWVDDANLHSSESEFPSNPKHLK